jgi:hypothetical protein
LRIRFFNPTFASSSPPASCAIPARSSAPARPWHGAPTFLNPVLFSSIPREPQGAEPGGLLPDRLLGRLVFGHRFSAFTKLFLFFEQCLGASALGAQLRRQFLARRVSESEMCKGGGDKFNIFPPRVHHGAERDRPHRRLAYPLDSRSGTTSRGTPPKKRNIRTCEPIQSDTCGALLCALYAPDPGSSLHSWLPDGVEHLTADGDRLGRHQHKGDDAWRRALVHPIVDGASLHQHVAGLEAHAGAVELHVDLA